MKTLYLDCGMGAAGDMLTAALYELLEERDKKAFLKEMNEAGIPGVVFVPEDSNKCGICGTHMSVRVHGEEEEVHDHDHEHAHEHNHVHDHHDHEHNHDHDHDHDHHDHDHEHTHDHAHDHDHHDHDHDHIHDHDHEHSHTHHHSSMSEISKIVDALKVSDIVKKQVKQVYEVIAEAESHIHGVPVTEIHFHEVGSMDAIADVTAVCVLMEKLGVEKVIASPVHVGSGHVHCAHGIMPVPAPATAYILKEIPMYGGEIKGELCTPTGAALLKHFVDTFGDMPVMKTEKVGYGMGKKDFPIANCVRAMLGELVQGTKNDINDRNINDVSCSDKMADGASCCTDEVKELSCNLDDMTAERIGFAMDRLLEEGALDVYTVPIGMKKSRPGVMLCVLCRKTERDKMVQRIFQYTSTLGIRENLFKRYTLVRQIKEQDTLYGKVRVKISEGYGVERVKYEYDDIAKIAKEQGISPEEVVKRISD